MSPQSLSVAVGDLNVREESSTTVYRQVLTIYAHESFKSDTLEHDIAVLQVMKQVFFLTRLITAFLHFYFRYQILMIGQQTYITSLYLYAHLQKTTHVQLQVGEQGLL